MQFLLYLGINIIMAINPNKTQKDQADHSQVQSSENEQGALKKESSKIAENYIIKFNNYINKFKKENNMFFAEKEKGLNESKLNNRRFWDHTQKFLVDFDKWIVDFDKAKNQLNYATHLVTLNEEYHNYIVTLIKQLDCVGDVNVKGKIDRFESMKSSEPTEVISESENYSIEQDLESLSVFISCLKQKPYCFELMENYEPKEVISESKKIIKEIKEVKAKIEIEKNMEDFPLSLRELEKITDKLYKDADVVLKKLKHNKDYLQEHLKRERESKISQLFKYEKSFNTILVSLKSIIKSMHDGFYADSKEHKHKILRYKDIFKDFLDKYNCFEFLSFPIGSNLITSDKTFESHFSEDFSKDVKNVRNSLDHYCIMIMNFEFDDADDLLRIDDLRANINDFYISLQESLLSHELSAEEQYNPDLEMIKGYISVVLDFCKYFEESNSSLEDLPENFKESISLCKDRYPEILDNILALSKDFEEFSKTLKSVKDSSTSNNPVHEYPSSTCQAVADINPASNSESISHSNPDEKKEIKEEAPSSNLAGCENEIVHSTNSENLSQI